MTNKVQAITMGWLTGVASFVSWLATMPPESQTSIVGPLVDLMPLTWRPNIGLVMRGLASASAIYGIYKAAHSGPQTPPKNPPTE